LWIAIWLSVAECRSAACFISTSFEITGLAAQTQPTRRPGASVLENEPQ
jgi:hypothetical protein